MRLLSLLLLALGLASCASVGPNGDSVASSRSVSEVFVTVMDEAPRGAVDPAEIAVLMYDGEARPLAGCSLVGRMFVETTSQRQMRMAAVETAVRFSAPVVVVGVVEQRTAHDAASRRALGAASVATRYQLDAFDCR